MRRWWDGSGGSEGGDGPLTRSWRSEYRVPGAPDPALFLGVLAVVRYVLGTCPAMSAVFQRRARRPLLIPHWITGLIPDM